MRKFLNRPLLALAAALGLVFLVILIRMYVNVIDRLSESMMVSENNRKESIKFGNKVKEFDSTTPVTAVIEGPELPYKLKLTPPMMKTSAEITLGYKFLLFYWTFLDNIKQNLFVFVLCFVINIYSEHSKR